MDTKCEAVVKMPGFMALLQSSGFPNHHFHPAM